MIKLQEVKNELQDVYNRLLQQKTAFLWLCFLYYIGYSSIIRANFCYRDDMGRASHGYGCWDNFSRYTSNFMSGILHGDTYLGDISPFTQYIAILFLALSGIILIDVFSDEDNKKFSIFKCLAILPMGLSPYFLECISYKYDCPYMAVSILAMVFPLLFRKQEKVFLITTFLGTLLMTTTYQASSGIYPAIVLALGLKMYCNGEDSKMSLRFLAVAVTGYALGLVVFKFFVMKSINIYVGTAIHPFGRILFGIQKNLTLYLSLVKSDFKTTWIIPTYALIVLYSFNKIVSCKNQKWMFSIIAIFVVPTIIFCSFGLYPLLEKPLFAPRAMLGVGVILSIMGIECISGGNRFVSYLGKMAVFSLAWLFVSFSFLYGNALNEYSRYLQFNIYKVVSSIEELPEFENNKQIKLQFKNSLDFPLPLKNNMRNYKILKRLVPDVLGNRSAWWNELAFSYYGLDNFSKIDKFKFSFTEDLTQESLPLIKDTGYNKIYARDNMILVEFK